MTKRIINKEAAAFRFRKEYLRFWFILELRGVHFHFTQNFITIDWNIDYPFVAHLENINRWVRVISGILQYDQLLLTSKNGNMYSSIMRLDDLHVGNLRRQQKTMWDDLSYRIEGEKTRKKGMCSRCSVFLWGERGQELQVIVPELQRKWKRPEMYYNTSRWVRLLLLKFNNKCTDSYPLAKIGSPFSMSEAYVPGLGKN